MSWMEIVAGAGGGGGGGGNPGYTKTTTTQTIIEEQTVTTSYDEGAYGAYVTQAALESAPETITATVDGTDYELSMTQDFGNGRAAYGDMTLTEQPFCFVIAVAGATTAAFVTAEAETHTIEATATVTTLVVSDDFKEAVQSLNLAVNLNADTLDKTWKEINDVFTTGGNVMVYDSLNGVYKRVKSTQSSGGDYYVVVDETSYIASSENDYPAEDNPF